MVPDSDLPSCAWLCGPPSGPSTPFGTPGLDVLDSLRVAVMVAAAVAVVLTVVLVRRACTAGQIVRFTSSAGLAVVAAATEVEHLGDDGNWRLIVAFMSLTALAWGNWSAFAMEAPAQPHWNLRRRPTR